jgi:hypothetical protein
MGRAEVPAGSSGGEGEEECVAGHEKSIGTFADKSGESRIDFADRAGIDALDFAARWRTLLPEPPALRSAGVEAPGSVKHAKYQRGNHGFSVLDRVLKDLRLLEQISLDLNRGGFPMCCQ